jgi:hypothetical protein
MYDVTALTEYPFPNDISDRAYRVFPGCMENDETIAFHGTSEQNFKAICEQGFRFAEVLQSLSFAKDSSGA